MATSWDGDMVPDLLGLSPPPAHYDNQTPTYAVIVNEKNPLPQNFKPQVLRVGPNHLPGYARRPGGNNKIQKAIWSILAIIDGGKATVSALYGIIDICYPGEKFSDQSVRAALTPSR